MRLRKFLFHLAAGASVLLFVLTAVMWMRSYWRGELIRSIRVGRDGNEDFVTSYALILVEGRTRWIWSHQTSTDRSLPGPGLDLYAMDLAQRIGPISHGETLLERIGFGYFSDEQSGRARFARATRWIMLPCWFLSLIFSVLPAIWIRATLHRRRRARVGSRNRKRRWGPIGSEAAHRPIR